MHTYRGGHQAYHTTHGFPAVAPLNVIPINISCYNVIYLGWYFSKNAD